MSSGPGTPPPRKMAVIVCRGPDCGDKRNSAAVHAAFVTELRQKVRGGLEVSLRWQSCFGQCQKGPNVLVREVRAGDDPFFLSFLGALGDRGALYHAVRPEDAARIVDEHVIGGRIAADLKRR
jgi:(2Fe-2S) ferredoxin